MTVASERPPLHTGLIEGIVWGNVASGAVALVAVIAAPAILSSILGITATVMAADLVGITIGAKVISDKREEYREAHPIVRSDTVQLNGKVQDPLQHGKTR
jgi:membrane glycosyltransferase